MLIADINRIEQFTNTLRNPLLAQVSATSTFTYQQDRIDFKYRFKHFNVENFECPYPLHKCAPSIFDRIRK